MNLEEICKKENKISNTQTWLIVFFFVLALAVLITVYISVIETSSSTESNQKQGLAFLLSLSVFAVYIVFGGIYNLILDRRLKKLQRERNELNKEENA